METLPKTCPSTVNITNYDQMIAANDFKSIQIVSKDTFLIGFYNCGMHIRGFSEARAKYNGLRRLTKSELAE